MITKESIDSVSLARWLCLLEAVIIIDKKADQLKVPKDDVNKNIPINKYIKERFPSMKIEVERDISNHHIHHHSNHNQNTLAE
jgi:hypothetical protein